MTKNQIEKRLAALGLRLEPCGHWVVDTDGRMFAARWIVRPNTVGSCVAKEIIPLRRLADAETLIDMREIARR